MNDSKTDPKLICDQIRSIYPEVGRCGIEVSVDFDQAKSAWIVDLEHAGTRLSTHLEPEDTQACLEGRECVTLGSKIGQLVANAERRPD
jgi:hypothetical protein